MEALSPTELDAALGWLRPRHHGHASECLQRIRWLCEQVEDLHGALLLVVATHQGIPRHQLASAVRQFRPELAGMPVEDVHSLINGLLNGGRDGFEAVQRSRKGARRPKTTDLPFIRPD